MSPRTPPPNVANLPHDLADFAVSVTLAPTIDDDRAAELGGSLSEGAALWLVSHASELRDALVSYAGLEGDEADALAIALGPRIIIGEARHRLELEAIEPHDGT